jgi:hypothetical protein
MRLLPLFSRLIDFRRRHSSNLFVTLQLIVLPNEWFPSAISIVHHCSLQAPTLGNMMFRIRP